MKLCGCIKSVNVPVVVLGTLKRYGKFIDCSRIYFFYDFEELQASPLSSLSPIIIYLINFLISLGITNHHNNIIKHHIAIPGLKV
jgi:hypothetical protein